MRQWARHSGLALAALLSAAAMALGTPAAAGSIAINPVDQAQAFATCAGRFQALATRQTALHDPRAFESRSIQGVFEQLLDATLPSASENGASRERARAWQASGWSEVAALMRRAQTGENPARAEADLNRQVSTCTRMILRG